MRARGVLYMAASAFAFSVMSMLVKVASARLPTGELVVARGVITLVLSYAMVVHAGLYPWGTERKKLALRGGLGFLALTGYYVAVVRLPLADATTLQQTIPLITAVLGWLVLGERVGWATGFALACGVAGVLLIVHPSGAGIDPLGVAIALAGALCSAVAYITVRSLSRTEHPLVIVFYFPLIVTPLALPWAIAEWVTPTPVEVLLLLAIGISTQAGQVFLTMGLAADKVARATTVGYLQVAFAMGWQLVIFGDVPTLATIAGAALIVGGTLAVARYGAAAPATPPPTPPPPST
jgi:drug/metabolite transporter (DMT)-like permease